MLVVLETLFQPPAAVVEKRVQRFGDGEQDRARCRRIGGTYELPEDTSRVRCSGDGTVTDLVCGVLCEILAVIMGRENHAPGRVWVLGRDHVRESLLAVWRHVGECVLLDVPVQSAERGDEMVLHEGVVGCVGCETASA